MNELAVIFGLQGPKLTAKEKAFFADVNPWAYILFARNIETPEQVLRLTDSLRDISGRNCLIFIDQEGGRVQRLRPPHWINYPSGAQLAEGYSDNKAARRRAVYLHHRLIADDLRAVGVTANCAPVLDIPQPGADAIISDRAFGETPAQIIDLAHAAMAGMIAGGTAPVVKHIPGHGRAMVDSHLALPRVDSSLDVLIGTDFRPFAALNDAPMAMTAHIVYEAVDNQHPLTLSKAAITHIIRGEIAYDGLLMSDDLDMKALSGSLAEKTSQAIAAGCDIALHCSGDFDAMQEVAGAAGRLSGKAKTRADIAALSAVDVNAFNREAALAEFTNLVPHLSAYT